MKIRKIFIGLPVFLAMTSTCTFTQQNKQLPGPDAKNERPIPGAEQTGLYFPLLQGKHLGVCTNQTGMVGDRHLVDTLLSSGFDVVRIFGPEHGFRGSSAAGETVVNDTDVVTGLPVVSLYGNKKKPAAEDLKGIDLVVFDIQDVGTRFYTYISTMSYFMEACAENDIPFMVLDRPNPNGDFEDGPVLKKEFSSFVGLHPVPVVYGMTIGEYAQMVNGEGWLKEGIRCNLTVIPIANYTHQTRYALPVPPSPNLPNMTAVYLYPSLCFFEGTIMSVGRGTPWPFQVIGHPDYALGSFVFTPESIPGVTLHPKFEGKQCFGQSLQGYADNLVMTERRLHLDLLISYYNYFKDKESFFTPYFDKLAGTDELRKQIEAGLTEDEICASWKEDLNAFGKVREKYLLYP